MSDNDNATVEAARITSRQTIVVAVITGLVSIITTLIATGSLGGPSANLTAAEGGESTNTNLAVLNAPELHFSTTPIDLSLDECMAAAEEGLERLNLGGQQERRYFRWGYDDETIGMIWCHTDEALAIFVASGTDPAATADLAEALRRSF